MLIDFYHLISVMISLFALVVLPFLPFSFAIFRKEKWPYTLMVAFILGCSVQAIVGLFWTHFLGKWPNGEVVFISSIWLISMAWGLSRLSLNRPSRFEIGFDHKHIILVLILLAALIVRSIHPMEVAFLGQSDAYTHLHYLQNIADKGYLINPAYPSGYHWILSLPVLVFSIDPYWIVRFGGAFFGVGLVLAIYVITEQLCNRRAAIFGSFLAACFPLMNLLMKTGVGAFANQFGLFLLPCIFLFYVQIVSDTKNENWIIKILFSMALCALAASVPMMLIHLMLILVIERILMLCFAPQLWLSKTFKFVLLIIPAFCTLLFHFTQIGPHQRFQTATLLVDYSEKKQTITKKLVDKAKKNTANYNSEKQKLALLIAKSPYMRMAMDYFMLKRMGFGNTYLNGVGGILFGLFGVLLCYAALKRKTAFVIIGIWGGLTSIQAATGILQFSSYQREGWSLLIATCCMCGILADQIYYFFDRFLIFKIGIGTIMAASFVWAVYSPPKHPMIQSGAEGLIIRSIRFFGQDHRDSTDECNKKQSPFCHVTTHLKSDLPLTLVTRRFLGWGNQGEITPNVIPMDSPVETLTIGNRIKNIKFQENRQYIVLIDKMRKLSSKQMMSAFTMVSPKMVTATYRRRNFLIRANTKILRYLEGLSIKKWQKNSIILSPYLTAHIVTPISNAIKKN